MGSSFKNPYEEEISFKKLAKDDPNFAKVLKPNNQLDFNDPAAVVQFTKSLLKRDFDLVIELPPNRLCPAVPNRLNYLLYIQRLLESSTPITLPAISTLSSSLPSASPTLQDALKSSPDQKPSERPITGLDIGTGASAIYPLLFARLPFPPNSHIHASDIDPLSLQYARTNIGSNNLSFRISLHSTSPDGPLIPLDTWQRDEEKGGEEINLDFVMCNPPFYTSFSELTANTKAKSTPPNSVCTGSPSEMVCEGGEVSFISRIITESLTLRTRVRWYTSMIGKLSSLAPLIETLKSEGCTNWAVGELVQGQTRRWVLGWSWLPWRPAVSVARGIGAGALEKKYLPFPSEFVVSVEEGKEVVGKRVEKAIGELPLSSWVLDSEKCEGTGFSSGDCWSRKARRMGKKRDVEGNEKGVEAGDSMAFGFRINLVEKDRKTEVNVRWLKGNDSGLFESFCGVVKRKVEQL